MLEGLLVRKCAQLEYVLQTDFEHGYELIAEIVKQEDREYWDNVYWYASANGLNRKHGTPDEFIASLDTCDAKRPEPQPATADEVLNGVRDNKHGAGYNIRVRPYVPQEQR